MPAPPDDETIVVDPALLPAPAQASGPKRFFELDDDGCIFYFIVARDLDHAKDLMRESKSLFGPDEVRFDEATTLTWTEMAVADVAKKTRCHTQDDRGTIPLADANVGEWFCTEW